MKLAVVALLLGVAAPLFADVSAPAPGAIRWRTDVGAAEREAAKGKRPLLLFFSAKWCTPCQEMLARSFADPAVAELVARRFVPLVVDLTDDDAPARAVADRFGVRAMPTLLVVRGSDERLRQESFLPAAELRAALDRVR
ncbi:MAG TPA: thioredoxin fold domain-containing protein [Polyangia bacterium]